MAGSFGIVEEKLREAQFFLDALTAAKECSLDARCYFSAFLSAARSVTLALQATMSSVAGFTAWYEQVQKRMKLDPLARFFVEIRNDSIHKGLNPLGEVTIEHLREHLFRQLADRKRTHVIVLPDLEASDKTVLADAVQICSGYLRSLVWVIFDCYNKFLRVVDPKWYFTRENFAEMGKGINEAINELGFPDAWASCMPEEPGAWKALRGQQPLCPINDIFERHLGRTIPDPDRG